MLDMWFNGVIFHSDIEKEAVVLEWMDVLRAETAKSMVFRAVQDSIQVIKNIHWSVAKLSPENLCLRMPPM